MNETYQLPEPIIQARFLPITLIQANLSCLLKFQKKSLCLLCLLFDFDDDGDGDDDDFDEYERTTNILL